MVFDLWGITALTTLVSATPAPAPAGVSWGLEIGKIVATGLVAFGAAFGGYKLANIGRKYDILYKERYKSFEEVAGFLYAVIYLFDNLIEVSEQISSVMNGDPARNLVADAEHSLKKLLDEIKPPNNRYLALLSPETRTLYYAALKQIDELAEVLLEIRLNGSGIESDPATYEAHKSDLAQSITKTCLECTKAVDSALADMKFPE